MADMSRVHDENQLTIMARADAAFKGVIADSSPRYSRPSHFIDEVIYGGKEKIYGRE
jgi:hypothetical protein